MIPKPFYSLINTSIGKDPAVVVVNTSLRRFKEREALPWHLRLTIECKELASNGMPTTDEVAVLDRLEDKLNRALQQDENAVFLARITCRGKRDLVYRVKDPEIASNFLQTFVAEPSHVRDWDFRMEHDSDWELARPELKLIERDSRLS